MTSSSPGCARRSVTVTAAVLSSLVLWLCFAIVPASAQSTPRHVVESAAGTTVSLVSLAPHVLGPTDTLSVTARVHNGSDTALSDATVTLGIDRRPSATRSALENWAEAGPMERSGARVGDQVVATLGAGADAEVTFTATAADLGLSGSSAWGPRGIVVKLLDRGVPVAALRTFVVWGPSGEVTPVGVGIAAALTGPPVNAHDDAVAESTLSAAVAPQGRLGRLLQATAAVPEVAWVADPALLAAANTSSDAETRQWAARALSATTGRTTFALHAYDPDLAAFAHTPGSTLPTDTPLPGASDPTAGWRHDLAWPASAVPDRETLGLASSAGAGFVVVGDDALRPDDDLTYTPTGLATVETPSKPVTALVADPVLTATVTRTGNETSTAQSIQRLLAETAVIARERPAEQRHMLIALPRSWDPDPSAFAAQIAALRGADWVSLSSVDTLLSAPVPDVQRDSLPDSVRSPDEMPSAQVMEIERARAEVGRFATIGADPTAISRPLEPGFVAPTAVAYRGQASARAVAVRRAMATSDAVLGSITVVPAQPTNLIADAVDLPIRVGNALDEDVTVRVALRPDDPRLKVDEIPTITVPARGEAQASIPVRAFGSGNVTVNVEILSTAEADGGRGKSLAEPSSFVVRVRAAWESVGTAVVAVLLGLAIVGGIWRTIRRGRSPRRLTGATMEQPVLPSDEPQPEESHR